MTAVVVSVALLAAANWLILLIAAVSEGSKSRMCFERCYPERHLDGWTVLIFLPLLVLAVTVLAMAIGRGNLWKVWRIGRLAALASLLVVAGALLVNIDALSSIPPWHWLDALRIEPVT